jgi:hypothetical protein
MKTGPEELIRVKQDGWVLPKPVVLFAISSVVVDTCLL